MKRDTTNFAEALAELSVRINHWGAAMDSSQQESIELYCRLLAQYNEHTNLVSKADPASLISEHVADAWALVPVLAKHLSSATGPLIDIGSGAGFPGLVLSIAMPELKVALVESIAKKARFLSQAVVELGLSHRVQVLNGRAEEIAHDPRYRGKFAAATARAVGSLDYIAELALPLLQSQGWLLAQKSKRQLESEQLKGEKSLPLLGGEISEIIDVDLQVVGKDHVVILVKKTATTPDSYPRPGRKNQAAAAGLRFVSYTLAMDSAGSVIFRLVFI